MHLRRTILAVAVGITAPAAVLAAPALASDGPPTNLVVPDQSPDTGKEKTEAHDRKSNPDKGVTVSIREVPDTFTAGGPWQELTLVVNAEPTDTDREVILVIEDNESLQLTPDFTDVQVRGTSGWQDVGADPWSNSTAHYTLVVPAGATQLSVRVRFHQDAPLVHFSLAAQDGINVDSPSYESKLILPADPGDPEGGEPTDPADPGGGDPTEPTDPGGGEPTHPSDSGTGEASRPGSGAGTGDPAGSAGSGTEQSDPSNQPSAPGLDPAASASVTPGDPASTPSGTLAETGSAPIAAWLLGTGGTAIALGAALHRFRRRPTS